MPSSPTLEEMRLAIVDAIKAADPEAGERVYSTLKNAIEPKSFVDTFVAEDSQNVHAWALNYMGQAERREDDAKDLYWIRHRWEAHLWLGPFDHEGDSFIVVQDLVEAVTDALESDASVFPVPEITERTVTGTAIALEHVHERLAHHAILTLEITASQFKVAA